MMLVYVALVTPYHIAFLQAYGWDNIMEWIGLFVIDKLVDCLFVMDMVINFRSAWLVEDDDDPNNGLVQFGCGEVGHVQSAIHLLCAMIRGLSPDCLPTCALTWSAQAACRYVKGWFWIDFVSIFPLDLLELSYPANHPLAGQPILFPSGGDEDVS